MLADTKNKKWIAVVLTIVAFVAVSFIYEMDYWLMQKPKSVHVWRQCDGASYALNYYQNARPLFKPQVHHRLAKDGETCSEFPIIYYVASKLYHIFGYNDYYIRWLGYLIFFASLITLTLTSFKFIRNAFLATVPALIWMSSCLSMYYAGNFLPDMPALSFALIGFYFFISYTESKRLRSFVFAISFSTLAALLKVSSALILVAIIFYMAWAVIRSKKILFNWQHFLIVFFGCALVAGWVFYARWYNVQGGYDGNLLGTSGIWLIEEGSQLQYIITRTINEWLPAIFSFWVWGVLSFVLLLLIIQPSQFDSRLRFFGIVLFLGVVSYLLSFFTVFDNHDYYLINTLCLPVILSIAFVERLDKMKIGLFKYAIITTLILILGVNVHHGSDQMNFRKNNVAYNSQVDSSFYTITPYLRKIGIERTDMVFAMPDGSTNIPLYLMNNPGFTTFAGRDIPRAKADGAQYLVISDEKLLDAENVKPYLKDSIGFYNGIYVYRL